MAEAWKKLYGEHFDELPVTDLYVRFLPADASELKRLHEMDLNLEDHPLDYEIAEEGWYYHDPEIPEGQITWQYTTVKPDFIFPDIQHEVISRLTIPPFRSYLTAEAHRIKDIPYGDTPTLITTGCNEDCFFYPDCLIDPSLSCDDDDDDGGGGGGGGGVDPPCGPDSPTWPDCLMIEIEPGTPFPGDVTFNDCGCPINSNPRRPSGCVRYEDTQLGHEGVRNVEVIARNLFTYASTFTDDNGCYSINQSFSGNVRLSVKFKSSRITVRGIQGAKLWGFSEAVKDPVGKFTDGNYNDINVVYGKFTDDDHIGKMYWYACHANNTIYEYDEFSEEEGILSTPDDMDVLLTNYNTAASAPMFDEISSNPAGAVTASGIVYAGTFIAMGTITTFLGFGPTAGSLPAFLLTAYVVAFAPDVQYGYGGEDKKSDDINNTFYHEYAHAAHYNALLNKLYYVQNVLYVIEQFGYGDGTDAESGRVAVIEAWGNHIGHFFADRRYGLSHGNASNNATMDDMIFTSWKYWHLEQFDPVTGIRVPPPGVTSWSAATLTDALTDRWIPEGLLYDCMDNDAVNPMNVSDPVIDNVVGFTNANFLTALATGPDDLIELRDFLKGSSLPTGQVPAEVDSLFARY